MRRPLSGPSRTYTAYFQRCLDQRARVVLTSGGIEPVADGGGDGHSVFARAFLVALADNTGVLDSNALLKKIQRPVQLNADQKPEFGELRPSGHEGGDFLFVRRGR